VKQTGRWRMPMRHGEHILAGQSGMARAGLHRGERSPEVDFQKRRGNTCNTEFVAKGAASRRRESRSPP